MNEIRGTCSYTAEDAVYFFPELISYAGVAPEDVGWVKGAFDYEAGGG